MTPELRLPVAIRYSLVCAALLVLAGCVTAIANHFDQAAASSRGKQLLQSHLEMIEHMRARNDPMGDYLWAQANADSWVPNPEKDPLLIKKMYEDAAAKGSIDAEHVLGLMLIDGSSSRNICMKCPVLKPEDRNPQLGLQILEKAIKKQCFYWGIRIDGMAKRQCLTPVTSAGDVWPNLRDGAVFAKNLDEAKRWKAMEDSCIADLKRSYLSSNNFPVCR